MLLIDRKAGWLADGEGKRFDPARRQWFESPGLPGGEAVDANTAVKWLQRDSGHPIRIPVGVIGPRDATAEQIRIAEEIGSRLAESYLSMICGGRQGIMEAACRGAANKGGISIGLLPEPDPSLANPYVTVPIATGIGEARNALVARAAFCLIAIGNSYGTLSEVALGLQFGKTVFGIAGAANVPGVKHRENVNEMISSVSCSILSIPEEEVQSR